MIPWLSKQQIQNHLISPSAHKPPSSSASNSVFSLMSDFGPRFSASCVFSFLPTFFSHVVMGLPTFPSFFGLPWDRSDTVGVVWVLCLRVPALAFLFSSLQNCFLVFYCNSPMKTTYCHTILESSLLSFLSTSGLTRELWSFIYQARVSSLPIVAASNKTKFIGLQTGTSLFSTNIPNFFIKIWIYKVGVA